MDLPTFSPYDGEYQGTQVTRATAEQLDQAARLYRAAVGCTGYEPSIETVFVGFADLTGMGGFTRTFAGRTRALIVIDFEFAHSLAHEIGHLWFNGEPSALVEGRAEVLGRCANRADPVFELRLHKPIEVDGLEDLRTWTYDPYMVTEFKESHYEAARMLLVALGELVGPEFLYASHPLTWDEIVAAARSHGPAGERIAEAIEGGKAGQAWLFGNPDADDWVNLFELVRGTDPEAWDSDGDGAWDGAPREVPEHAVPAYADGRPNCLPMRAGDGAMLRVFRADVDGTVSEVEKALEPGDSLYTLKHRPGLPNAYILPGAGEWEPNPGCRANRYGSAHVTASDERLERSLQPILDALGPAWDDAEQVLGEQRRSHRLVIELGGPETRVVPSPLAVRFSSAQIKEWKSRRQWGVPARLAVAVELAHDRHPELLADPARLDAFVHEVYPDLSDGPYFSAPEP